MKTIIILMMSFLLMTSLCTAVEVKAVKQFKYACILFNQKGQVAFEGTLNAQQFKKWFTPDNVFVGGTRIEPPDDARVFGVLVLTNGEKILTMPLYVWMNDKLENFVCQSYVLGLPPIFRIHLPHLYFGKTATRQDFLEEMKVKLIEISKEK